MEFHNSRILNSQMPTSHKQPSFIQRCIFRDYCFDASRSIDAERSGMSFNLAASKGPVSVEFPKLNDIDIYSQLIRDLLTF